MNVIIPTSAARNAVYDHDGYLFGRFCETSGIPTGAEIPSAVATLAGQAANVQPRWVSWNQPCYEAECAKARAEADARREALLSEARAILADAQQLQAAE